MRHDLSKRIQRLEDEAPRDFESGGRLEVAASLEAKLAAFEEATKDLPRPEVTDAEAAAVIRDFRAALEAKADRLLHSH